MEISADQQLEYATSVAQHLGEGWAAGTALPRYGPTLRHLDGSVMIARVNPDKTVRVSGVLPNNIDNTQNHCKGPSIKFSANKTPAQAAAEIKRRLLPGYIEEFKATLLSIERQRLEANQREAFLVCIKALLPGYSNGPDAESYKGSVIPGLNGGWVNFRYSGSEAGVEVTARYIPRDLAVQVAETIARYIQEKAAKKDA